jgi:CDGSH-type Zn-finger protein
VTLVPNGPVLIEGPVEVVLPDGRTVTSDRFVVALCACRRSRRYPWCDTSHRRSGHARRSGPVDGGAQSGGQRAEQ